MGWVLSAVWPLENFCYVPGAFGPSSARNGNCGALHPIVPLK